MEQKERCIIRIDLKGGVSIMLPATFGKKRDVMAECYALTGRPAIMSKLLDKYVTVTDYDGAMVRFKRSDILCVTVASSKDNY